MEPVVYIETTIPSYYFDQRASLWFEIRRTQEWWEEERSDYELITSEAVFAELDDFKNPHREDCIRLIENIPSVSVTREVISITHTYKVRNIMPGGVNLDALHLALASYYRADFLLTWNCRHLANPNKFSAIRQINTELGIFVPVLTTPHELRRITEEDSHDAET